MTERSPLFVFGTLRSGQCHHNLIYGRYDKRLQARLYGYGRVGKLMIEERENDAALGELFFLTEATYDQVMAACDELESIPPGELIGEWYERKRVTVSTEEGEFEAWAYVKPQG